MACEPDPVWIANVRFLAGYRREWLLNQGILNDILQTIPVQTKRPLTGVGSTSLEQQNVKSHV